MLYFAYGSNLNHNQMKNIRCFGSKYIKSFFLKDYKLIFSHPNKLNKFGYGNIMKEYFIKDPPKSYIDVINEGYKDCNIDLKINYRF